MAKEQDQHFRNFATALEGEIAKVPGFPIKKRAALIEVQKAQVQEMIDLEYQLKMVMFNHQLGVDVVQKFFDYILIDRHNILDGRPFFRERQKDFTKTISPAIRSRDTVGLIQHNLNYRFFYFADQNFDLGPKYKELLTKLRQIRLDLCTTNLPMAITRAKIFLHRNPRNHLTFMDLVQICCEGLMAAIDKYAPDPNARFLLIGVAIGRCTGNLIQNSSVDKDTILFACDKNANNAYVQVPKKIEDFQAGDHILGVDHDGKTIYTEVRALHDHGTLEGFEVTFNDGYQIICSQDHKFLTDWGMVPIKDIVKHQLEVLCEPPSQDRWLANQMRIGTAEASTDVRPSLVGLSQVQGGGRIQESGCFGSTQSQNEPGRWMANQMWAEFSNQAKMVRSQQELLYVSTRTSGGSGGQFSSLQGDSLSSGRMDIKLRSKFQEAAPDVRPSFKLFSLPGDDQERSSFANFQMAKGELGIVHQEFFRERPENVWRNEKRPCQVAKNEVPCKDRASKMERIKSGGISRNCSQSLHFRQEIRTGSLDEKLGYSNVANGPDTVRGGTEADGLRVAGSQDLGGSGRGVPFQGNISQPPVETKSGSRCDVEPGVLQAWGCNVDSIIDDVLQVQRWAIEAGMAELAFKHAPLATTGSLVRRRVIRVRAVGERRMYDLEVAHPKHNFLLPNGIITSNSETLIHFWPGDRRLLYNLNKLMAMAEVDDLEGVVEKMNKTLTETASKNTNLNELSGLANASGIISSDVPIDEEGKITISDSVACPTDNQPDSMNEYQSSRSSLYSSIGKLSVFQRKILKMKGISNDH